MKHFLVLGLIAVVCSNQAGAVNVAVGKPASQSSNWSADSTADKAVDGNTETYWSGNSCTATNADPNAWWKVDLQSEHAVDHVVLINREGCCPERLLGAVVRVGNSKDIASNTQCGNPVTSAQISASATITIECPDDTAGQFVSVQLEGQTQYLTLCELQVDDGTSGTSTGPVNVAVGKPASQSSDWSADSTADKAVDGNTETYWSGNSCTATNADPNAWWKVDLQSEHAVDHVVLINREGCCPERLLGAVVRVGNSQDIASNTQCGNSVTSAQISASATITIECPDGTAGQFVSVQLEGQTQYLTLCELQVFGEGTETSGSEWENVAVGKPAWQSSDWSGTSTADKAVDGNANPQWSGNSCTATNQNQDAWWKTDLQSRHTVGQVVLTNRQDCCPERLLGAIVRVGDSDDIASNTQCGSAVTSDQISASETITIDCPEGTKGRYVSVQLEGKNMWLTLCEVEIYGATFVATEAPPTQAPATEAPPTQAPVNPDATTMIPTLAPCEYPAGVKNVAAGRPSRQSSDKKNKDSGSENAVDGDYGTDAHSGSCSWTNKELEPWWTVDLGETKDIYEVAITNREDCCTFRIKNAEIRVGDSQTMEDNPVCGMRVLGRMTKENPIRIRCGCETPMQGRYVSIKLIDREQQLTLCEVEVLAT